MTDATTIEDAEFREVDDPAPPAPEEPVDARDAIQKSRALIPVGPSGATPLNFAQQVDFAKTMSQAKFSLPQFLCGNGGDCLAIIDIASRANLSPYMVASMCYLEPKSKRLSFMSQLYHALLIQSRMLVGDLEVTYDGEGDARTCTVTGKLRSDGKVRSHTSPPLAKVMPRRNEDGNVKGSPLWTKKPDVQLFYDTSRDWTRIYCPTATLGIFAPEEFVETPINPEGARDVTPLRDRIAGAAKTGEGFSDGHAARELSQIAPGGGKIIDADPPLGRGIQRVRHRAGTRWRVGSGRYQEPTAGKPASEPRKGKAARQAKPPTQAQVKAAADRAEKSSAERKTEPEAPKAKSSLRTSADYIAYAKAWIDAAPDPRSAQAQYDDERELRDKLGVPVKMRGELQSRIDHRFDR